MIRGSWLPTGQNLKEYPKGELNPPMTLNRENRMVMVQLTERSTELPLPNR